MVRRDAFVAGFSAALGVLVLAIAAMAFWRFTEAAIAISSPFVAGTVIALLLDPLVEVLRKSIGFTRGKRLPAVLLVFLLFLLLFGALVTWVVPNLVGQTQRLVRWFAPASFTVERALDSDGPFNTISREIDGTRYTARGLVNGTTYFFRIRPVTDDGAQNPLPVVSVMPTAETREGSSRDNNQPAPQPSPTPDTAPSPDPGTEPVSQSPVARPAGDVRAVPGDGVATLTWQPPPGARSGFDQMRAQIDTWLRSHRTFAGVKLPPSLEAVTTQYSDQLQSALRTSAGRVADVIVGSISGLLSTILIPIITFYLLADMDRLRARLLFLLPDRARAAFVHTARDIGGVFGGYLRGMLQVCLGYMVVATVGMFAVGFVAPPMRSYALLIGFAAGVLYAVPYVGFIGTALLTLVIALISGAGLPGVLWSIGLLFVLNQLFDNIMTPRIVGGGVGLHPILSMFALLLGASLFGLWGMLLAVPAAGSLQAVLFRLFPKLSAPTALAMIPHEKRDNPDPDTSGDDIAH